MKTTTSFRIFLLMVFISFVSHSAFAQTQQPPQQQRGGGEATTAKTRGDDPEIKTPKPEANVKGQEPEGFIQPMEKGAKARGEYNYCSVIVDNWTGWWLDVYIDGTYRGNVSPYGKGGQNVGAGNTRVYIVAEFKDGSRVRWGPVTKSCYDKFEVTVFTQSYNYNAR